MTLEDQIARLNTLAEPTAEHRRRLTTEEVREFLNNPPKRQRSIPAEEAMAAIVEAFRNAPVETRRTIATGLTEHARRWLLGYAGDMAVLAVRQNSTALIEQGLVALVVENGEGDIRDSLLAMVGLYHSAVKLGMDGQKTFVKIAKLAEPGDLKKEMNQFASRPPASRSLQAFGMEEEMAEDGFRYRRIHKFSIPPNPNPETPQQISARLTSSQRQALIGSAEALAGMAIRTQSPRRVEDGLQGLALGGGAIDPSFSRDALSKLYDAALKLGMDIKKTFGDAAEIAPEGGLKQEMIRFSQRRREEPPK